MPQQPTFHLRHHITSQGKKRETSNMARLALFLLAFTLLCATVFASPAPDDNKKDPVPVRPSKHGHNPKKAVTVVKTLTLIVTKTIKPEPPKIKCDPPKLKGVDPKSGAPIWYSGKDGVSFFRSSYFYIVCKLMLGFFVGLRTGSADPR